MVDEYDGDGDYRALDRRYFGTGLTDDDTESLSLARESLLDHNNRWVYQRGSGVTYNFFTRFESGDDIVAGRQFTSLGWNRYLQCPWPLTDGMRKVRFRLLCSIHHASLAEYRAEFRGAVRDPFQSSLIKTDKTVTGTGLLQVVEVEVDMTGEPVDAPLIDLIFAWKSASKEIRQSDSLTMHSPYSFDANSGSNANFSSSINEYTAIKGTVGQADIFQLSPPDSNGRRNVGINDERAPSTTLDLDTLSLTQVRPVGLHLEIEYDDDRAAGDYQPHQPEMNRPQKTAYGRHVSNHAKNLDAARDRIVCRALGPSRNQSLEQDGGGWTGSGADDDRIKWSWALEAKNQTLLDRQSIRLTGQDPTLVVYGYWAPFVMTLDKTDLRYLRNIDDATYTADVDLELQIYDSITNLNSLATQTRTFRGVQYHFAIPDDAYFLPHVIYWALSYLGTDLTWPIEASTPYLEHCFHEGAIRQVDVPLLQPIRMAVDLSGVAASNWDRQPIIAELSIDGYSNVEANSKFHVPSFGPSLAGVNVGIQTAYFESYTLH